MGLGSLGVLVGFRSSGFGVGVLGAEFNLKCQNKETRLLREIHIYGNFK